MPVIQATLIFFEKKNFTDNIKYYQNSLQIMYKRQAENLPASSVLFFGDSQIQGLAVAAIDNRAVNFGIGHQKIQDLARSIGSYPNLIKARRIIIGAGINDLLHNSSFEIDLAVAQMMNSIQCCHDKAVFLSVFPVNEMKLRRPGLNQRIRDFNLHLQKATEKTGSGYIDLYSSLSKEDGSISIEYDIGDGLHLNPTGYAILIQSLKKSLHNE